MRVWVIAVIALLAALPQAPTAAPRPAPLVRAAQEQPKPPGSGTVGGKSLLQWRNELTNEDPSKRALALLAIMQFEDASDAVPDILKRINDTDLSPRAKACLALRTIVVHPKQVPDVVKALATRLYRKNETEAVIRYEAAAALRRFAFDAGPAIPALINGTLDRTSWEIRHVCAATMWRAALNASDELQARAVRALLDLAKYDRHVYQVRLEAIIGLGAMGRPADTKLAAEVIDFLENSTRAKTQSANRGLKLWAYAGLVMLGDAKLADTALGALVQFLKDDELEIRVQAAAALGALGERSKKRVPALIAMVTSDKEALAVHAAAGALAQIGDKSDKVINALMSVMEQDKDPRKAGAAVIALVNLKANDKRVLDVMSKMRENKDLDIHLRALLEAAEKELKKPPPPKEPKK